MDNLDNKRFIDYSIKVKDVLSSFHVKALDYHIKRLEKLIDFFTLSENVYMIKQLGVLKTEIAVDIARTKCDAYDELNEIYAR